MKLVKLDSNAIMPLRIRYGLEETLTGCYMKTAILNPTPGVRLRSFINYQREKPLSHEVYESWVNRLPSNIDEWREKYHGMLIQKNHKQLKRAV